MPYLSVCSRRQWEPRPGRWVCGLDALDCPPPDPAPMADCPRFAPSLGVCPVCLSLGRASQLAVDTEPQPQGPWPSPPLVPHWACPRCGWDGGPSELLDGLGRACRDLLDDVGFWRGRPERLAVDMGVPGSGRGVAANATPGARPGLESGHDR